jgi:hypothetical protein
MKTPIEQLASELDASRRIVVRAAAILASIPPFTSVDNDEFAYVRIEVDGFGEPMARVSWPEVATGYYDSTSVECQSATFPARLLTMTTSELAAYVNVKCSENHDRQMRDRSLREQARLASERAEYERLREKFESTATIV